MKQPVTPEQFVKKAAKDFRRMLTQLEPLAVTKFDNMLEVTAEYSFRRGFYTGAFFACAVVAIIYFVTKVL